MLRIQKKYKQQLIEKTKTNVMSFHKHTGRPVHQCYGHDGKNFIEYETKFPNWIEIFIVVVFCVSITLTSVTGIYLLMF